MIDNFNRLEKYIKEKEGYFYPIFLVKRLTDLLLDSSIPELPNKYLKIYFIHNIEEFKKYKNQIITLSEILEYRVYINIYPYNLIDFNSKFINVLYKRLDKEILTELGSYCFNEYHKTLPLNHLLIDIDFKDIDKQNEIINYINSYAKNKNYIKEIIPTNKGIHLITDTSIKNIPIDEKSFHIIDNGCTILYFPNSLEEKINKKEEK